MITAVAAATVLAAGLVAGTPAASASSARTFKNCTAMHRVYPHGVGKRHAHDRTSGKPVTNFKRSNPLYAANKKSDRDHDGVACEKR